MPALELTHLQVTSPRLPRAFDGLRLIALGDVHFIRPDPLCDSLYQALADTPADLLVVLGDVSAWPKYWKRAAAFLHGILQCASYPLGAYGVLGNHDSWKLRHNWSDPRLRFLRNESCYLRRGGQSIRIAGIEQLSEFGGDLPAALACADQTSFTLLLTHYPTATLWARYYCVDLILSGHTHGGQVRLPGIGPLHSGLKGHRHLVCGFQRLDHALLYVTRGIGYSGPFRARLFCRPELPVITLRRADRLSGRALPPPDQHDGELLDRVIRWIV